LFWRHRQKKQWDRDFVPEARLDPQLSKSREIWYVLVRDVEYIRSTDRIAILVYVRFVDRSVAWG
jgi:hypothetical protein